MTCPTCGEPVRNALAVCLNLDCLVASIAEDVALDLRIEACDG